MNLANVVLRMETIGDKYSITLREMTKDQFHAVLDALNIPIIFVGGDISKPALARDSWQRAHDGGKIDR